MLNKNYKLKQYAEQTTTTSAAAAEAATKWTMNNVVNEHS